MKGGEMRSTNIVGQKFGRLLVVAMAEKRKYMPFVLTLCDCGTQKEINFYKVKNGTTLSCGCFRNERVAVTNTRHGLSHKHPAYSSWMSMKKRCSNPDSQDYRNYGGRGIAVCEKWMGFAG